MRIAIAIVLLGLPLLCLYGAVMNRRARALFIAAGVVLLLANPLANASLLAPLDSALQSRMFDKARDSSLLGADESRAVAVLGKPWRERALDGQFKTLLYAPCRICMSAYMQPFLVYLENGKVIGFRSGERVEAARDR